MYRLLFLFVCCSFQLKAQERLYDKEFFANSKMPGGYFYSSAAYQSPSWIENERYKLPVEDQTFFSPGNSLMLHYSSSKNGSWKADILYHPIRGVDNFSPAMYVVFWLYIRSNTSGVSLPLIAIGKDSNSMSPLLPLQRYVSQNTFKKWIRIAIPLQHFGEHFEAHNVNLIRFSQQNEDAGEHVMYLDQIELLPEIPLSSKKPVAPLLSSAKGFEKHVDLSWPAVKDPSVKYITIYRSADGRVFHPVAIQPPYISRYADFTDTTGKKFFYKISAVNRNYEESAFSDILSATTHQMTDSALLDMVQEACFRYYWEGAEQNSGLALEDIPGRQHMVATGASGFGIMALIAGVERKFITRRQAINRFDTMTDFLMKAEKFHGAFAHFMDGRTGKVVPFFGAKDNGGDLVETSFLMQGLMCARQYFCENTADELRLRKRIDTIWKGIEWDWYRISPDSKFLYWHWSPDKGWIIHHPLIGWNETMITYILAIASPTHPVPASMYYSGWASQDTSAMRYRSSWGRTTDGERYTNGNTYFGIPLPVGVSNGGPLFFTHYSFMGPDPHLMKDAYTDYFTNNRNIALINYRYCVENPGNHRGYGPGGWGLTASDGPWRYSADEPVPHADHGKLSPTGALASFPYLPEASLRALKNYYRSYGKFLWGAYGFYDAFNLDENWCSGIFMGLNQAPVTVMIENYRTQLLWKLFMSAPEIQEGMRKIRKERENRK